jgi:hypothetical protein
LMLATDLRWNQFCKAECPSLAKIGFVAALGIDQPEAAGRDGGADRIWPVGAVDAIDGGARYSARGRPAGCRVRRP